MLRCNNSRTASCVQADYFQLTSRHVAQSIGLKASLKTLKTLKTLNIHLRGLECCILRIFDVDDSY